MFRSFGLTCVVSPCVCVRVFFFFFSEDLHSCLNPGPVQRTTWPPQPATVQRKCVPDHAFLQWVKTGGPWLTTKNEKDRLYLTSPPIPCFWGAQVCATSQPTDRPSSLQSVFCIEYLLGGWERRWAIGRWAFEATPPPRGIA